jgi:serine/threonine-protein kinase
VYYAVSDTGVLAYAPTGVRHRLVWVDRAGAVTPITTDREAFRIPRLSPDGTRVAIAINDATRRSDIWVYDIARGTKVRLTSESHNLAPVWKSDSGAIAFNTGTGPGNEEIVEVAADGSGRRTVLHGPSQRPLYPLSWTRDGYAMLLNAGSDIVLLALGAKEGVRALLADRSSDETDGRFSPNDSWVAYVSDESGRQEVYVVRYPSLDRKTPISNAGGNHPVWSRDGKELFYRQGDAMMAVEVSAGGELKAGLPRRLFAGAFTGVAQDGSFDVAPDGKRFVMVMSDEAATLNRLTLVQNWADDVKRKSAR